MRIAANWEDGSIIALRIHTFRCDEEHEPGFDSDKSKTSAIRLTAPRQILNARRSVALAGWQNLKAGIIVDPVLGASIGDKLPSD
ncbi:MAG: hypothetical protein ABIT16_02515 [Croceibacterium sp.]